MSSQHLIIHTCRHILPTGHHCQGAAVRSRACCRHHLDTRTRLHNMARARRRSLILRFCIPKSPRALALNQAEVSRVLATERIDPDAARMMLWAMNLSAAALHAESALLRIPVCAPKPNEIYQVPLNSLLAGGRTQNPAENIENIAGREGGGHPSE